MFEHQRCRRELLIVAEETLRENIPEVEQKVSAQEMNLHSGIFLGQHV